MRLLPTKRGWKRLGIGLAIVAALALIANGIMAWRTEARLQSILAEIRAAGDPASLADLTPEPIPADENAAAILGRIAPRLEQFGKELHSLTRGSNGNSYDMVETQGMAPTPEQIENVRKILDRFPDIDEAISKAAACDRYASLADFSLPPSRFIESAIDNIQVVRAIGRFVPWRMRVLVADSQPDTAIERGIEFLNLTRSLESEPLLINYLVVVAMHGVVVDALHRVLAANPVSDRPHAELDCVLQELDDPQRLVRALRTERAFSASLTAAIGTDAFSDNVSPTLLHVVGWPMKRHYLTALESFDRLTWLATQPWAAVCRELGTPDSPPSAGQGPLADLLAPVVKAAIEANGRDLTILRALRISNALAEYRDTRGHEASGLSDLSLPKDATVDPFSGESLKVRHTDDGWLIYSVMQNGVDDGGDFTDLKDFGLAPRKRRATE